MPEIGGTCLAFSSHLFSPVGTLPIDGEGRCCFQLFELLCVMPRSSWFALVLKEKILGGKKNVDAELGFCLAAICYTGFEAGTSKCSANRFSCLSGFPLSQVAANKMSFFSVISSGTELLGTSQISPQLADCCLLWPVDGSALQALPLSFRGGLD